MAAPVGASLLDREDSEQGVEVELTLPDVEARQALGRWSWKCSSCPHYQVEAGWTPAALAERGEVRLAGGGRALRSLGLVARAAVLAGLAPAPQHSEEIRGCCSAAECLQPGELLVRYEPELLPELVREGPSSHIEAVGGGELLGCIHPER